MKTREQIYGQEAAGILRDVSMYRALTEMQLLKLYPHKESKIRNLLSYLQKQGRIVQRGEYYRIPADAEESIDHGLSKAVWVLTDFMEQVEYHSVSEYPAKIIFFADGEVYEIIYAEPGKEQLINQMLSTVKEVPPKYIVLIEQPEQIAEIHTPNTSGYCTVSSGGEVQYYAPYLEGVILYSHNSNAYWPEGSEYDDDQPPLCQSFDGKVGYGEPGGTCADCVLNQFGSDGNNKGKACKNMRMLYLLRSGEYMPIQIALPPTSLMPYTRFVNEAFLSRRRKVCTGVVRIGLKKAVSGSHEYCVATFTKIADFAGEDLAHIRAYADGFVAQIKDINAQRAQAGAAASNIIGDGDASHLELPDNGAHFALGAVIDGEREELPA